ncbi:MAG: amidohydrolase family protein [Promicromonosporaceae bacterium]|nr:amidohydrolase family protein [Promicromonosporaceae bacterium]
MNILRGRLVLPEVVIDDGALVIEGDRIAFSGAATRLQTIAAFADLPLPPLASDTLLLPGLVDIHNHGGGGASFPDATDAEAVRAAAATHLAAGTTTLIASLVTADRATLLRRAELLADLADAGVITGIHVEGPFLSHEKRGAQSPDHLIAGDAGFVRELAAAARGRNGQGHLRTMTVAPEVPGVAGAGGAAEALIEAGVIPSLGHTSGTCEQAEALIAQVAPALAERGLTMTATHLFNGMPSMLHRAPGPVAACLAAAARGEMVVELVADGVHLDSALVRSLMAMLPPESVALVTDAMAAAGMPDGRYQLGPMTVAVGGGVARLTTTDGTEGSIAGGTSRLLDVIRTSVAGGVPLAVAVRAASWNPARALGLRDAGALTTDLRADVVVTDSTYVPRRVFRAGIEVGNPS